MTDASFKAELFRMSKGRLYTEFNAQKQVWELKGRTAQGIEYVLDQKPLGRSHEWGPETLLNLHDSTHWVSGESLPSRIARLEQDDEPALAADDVAAMADRAWHQMHPTKSVVV